MSKKVTFRVLFNVLTCRHKSVTLLNQNIGNYTVCKTNRFFILHYVQKVCIAFRKQKTNVTETEQRRWLFVLYWEETWDQTITAGLTGSSGATGISTGRTAAAAPRLICPSRNSLLAWTSSHDEFGHFCPRSDPAVNAKTTTNYHKSHRWRCCCHLLREGWNRHASMTAEIITVATFNPTKSVFFLQTGVDACFISYISKQWP